MMSKVLEIRAKSDEERFVKLGRNQADNADKKYDEGAKKLAKIESSIRFPLFYLIIHIIFQSKIESIDK